jgi:hypothetical protein
MKKREFPKFKKFKKFNEKARKQAMKDMCKADIDTNVFSIENIILSLNY